MKSFGFMFGVLIAVVIGFAGFYFYNETYEQTLKEIKNNSADYSLQQNSSDSAALSAVLPIPNDWQTFNSAKFGYSLKHPKDINTETTQEGDRFYKLGPTQALGTELFDGISLTIRSGKLNNTSLEEFVNEQHKLLHNQPTTETITEVVPVSYGVYQGLQFTVSSLGETNYIYLPKSETEYLEIIDSTVEPTNREQTFKNIVLQIISSIQF